MSSVWNPEISWQDGKKISIVEFITNPYAVKHFWKIISCFCLSKQLIDQTERSAFNIITYCVCIEKYDKERKSDFHNLFSKKNFEPRIDVL